MSRVVASHTSPFATRKTKSERKKTRDAVGQGKEERGYKRRQWVLSSVSLFAVIGSDDPVTVLNGVLSGYGLPTLKQKSVTFSWQFEDDFTFQYPKSWVIVRNRIRRGIYVSDFKTADKITVEVFPASDATNTSQERFVQETVARFISPGEGQQNNRLELPPPEKIKTSVANIDGVDYVYIEFPSSTITRSGYQVKRLNTAVAAQQEAMIYALCASTRSEEASSEKEEIFQAVIESFRVR